MQPIQLIVEHRLDQQGNPIAEVSGLPRLGALLYPDQMQQLGRQLIQAAIVAQQGERGTRLYPAEDRTMTEQQACTLCGAGWHTAANCIWNGSEKGLALAQRIDKNLDERAQFESWVRREWPGAPLHHVRDALPVNDPRYGEYCNENIQRGWVGWQARAALAQPSPARCQCCGYLVTDSEHRGCLRSAYPVVVTLNDSGAILAVTRQDAEGSVLSVIAEAQSSPKCATCNDNGRIGGPSFYAPDEGGDPCPDCAQPSPAPELDDQAFDRNAERLTLQALGPGAGINPEATSIDDLFLDEAPAPGMERPEVVAWSNWKVGTRSHIPFRTEEEAARSVNASEIAATQEGPYSVEPLMTVSQHRRIDAARLASVRVLADEVLELAAQRDAAQARVAELIAALEHAAASMWNSEANMDNAAAEAEEAIGNAKSGAPVAQAGQVPNATERDRQQGWTLDYRFIERVTDLAASRTEYTTSMEATEQVLLAARELLAAAPQPAGGE